MTIKEILKEYLKENGYDGLCNESDEGCGCHIDNLMPCDNANEYCQPGYQIPDITDKYDYIITPVKPTLSE